MKSLLSILCLVTVLTSGASTYYVATNGVDAVGRGSEAAPFKTIQYAVDQASSSSTDTIRVQPGIYDEGGKENVNGTPHTNRVMISKRVNLESVGGASVTHIVGAPDPTTGTVGAGAIRCIYTDNGAANSRIIGFTLRDGYGDDGSTDHNHRGGGFLQLNGQKYIYLYDCVISNCHNIGVGGSSGGFGAGLYDFGSKPIWVENTIFENLKGGQGGKYYIALKTAGGTTITNCDFRDCSASYYVIAPGGATSRLLDSRMERCSGGSGIITGIPVVERCAFCGNRSEIFYRASLGPVRNCLFVSNTAAIVTLVDVSDKRARFENCTFADNNGNNSSVVSIKGGNVNNQVAFVNCALWGNTKDVNRTDKTWQETHLVAYTNCLVEAYTEDVPETHEGCIVGLNPRFVDPASGNYRPRHNSPLRDKGLTLDWMTEGAIDLDGKPRRLDKRGKPTVSALPDIGSYECDIPKPGIAILVK